MILVFSPEAESDFVLIRNDLRSWCDSQEKVDKTIDDVLNAIRLLVLFHALGKVLFSKADGGLVRVLFCPFLKTFFSKKGQPP
jgi:hypothetical protein